MHFLLKEILFNLFLLAAISAYSRLHNCLHSFYNPMTYRGICRVTFTLFSELFKGPTLTEPFKSDFQNTLYLHTSFLRQQAFDFGRKQTNFKMFDATSLAQPLFTKLQLQHNWHLAAGLKRVTFPAFSLSNVTIVRTPTT